MFLRAATLMFVPFLFQPLLFVWFSSVAVSSSPLFILCMLRAFGPYVRPAACADGVVVEANAPAPTAVPIVIGTPPSATAGLTLPEFLGLLLRLRDLGA